tara:strand:- start:12 stop:842 length:831 start_codon:yes stop_codon:yes gene_type:complete
MAKKKETTKVSESIVEETVVVEQPKVEAPKIKAKPVNKWEVKDRVYVLVGNRSPLSKSIRTSNLFWFDKEKGYEREIKYCQNQRTVFVDEMQGEQRLEHVVFRSGTLFVPKEKVTLQKFLSLYHPHKGKVFYEVDEVKKAKNHIDWLELEIEALTTAKDLDVDMAEAIMRVEIGSKINDLSSKELRRDLLLYAKKNPLIFLELVNDKNIQLRNFGIKATEMGILKLSPDQRYFSWGSNNRKLMTVPFDEHPYSALAAWFKTDEGMEIYSNIEKRIK